MKRILLRPGRTAQVSEEALVRARRAADAFGVSQEKLREVAAFKGDVALGKRSSYKVLRPATSVKKSPPSTRVRKLTFGK